MTGPIGRVLPRALGRDFDESCDSPVYDLEHGAGSPWIKVWRAVPETCLKAKQLPYVSLPTDLYIPSAHKGWKKKESNLV